MFSDDAFFSFNTHHANTAMPINNKTTIIHNVITTVQYNHSLSETESVLCKNHNIKRVKNHNILKIKLFVFDETTVGADIGLGDVVVGGSVVEVDVAVVVVVVVVRKCLYR